MSCVPMCMSVSAHTWVLVFMCVYVDSNIGMNKELFSLGGGGGEQEEEKDGEEEEERAPQKLG